jgi:uncharacterized membrane protein YdfJ with MMPL/SSD domain
VCPITTRSDKAAVLLDATLVRGVLLPATLTVLGERAHHGPRWIPRIATEAAPGAKPAGS